MLILQPKLIIANFLMKKKGIRETDIFIVSYPKSGGSWFCTLIANIVKTGPEESLNLWTANKYVPDINNIFSSRRSLRRYAYMGNPRFFFVHTPYTPLLPKVIYILRDVRDVLVSYYHWTKMKRNGFNLSLYEFLTQYNFWPCSWDRHVEGWLLNNNEIPLLIIRYEDLLGDTLKELTRALEFCKINCTSAMIQQAVEISSFDRMQQEEDKQNLFMHAKMDHNGRFARRGKAGSWRDELCELSIDAIMNRYGETMKKIGYPNN